MFVNCFFTSMYISLIIQKFKSKVSVINHNKEGATYYKSIYQIYLPKKYTEVYIKTYNSGVTSQKIVEHSTQTTGPSTKRS